MLSVPRAVRVAGIVLVLAGAGLGLRAADELEWRQFPGRQAGSFSVVALQGDRLLAMWTPNQGAGFWRSSYDPARKGWSMSETALPELEGVSDLMLVAYGGADTLGLLTVEAEAPNLTRLYARRSEDRGVSWGEPRLLRHSCTGFGSHAQLAGGSAVVNLGDSFLFGGNDGAWRAVTPRVGRRETLSLAWRDRLVAVPDGSVAVYSSDRSHCYLRRVSADGETWSQAESVQLPAGSIGALARMGDGRVVAVGYDHVLRRGLAARVSYDGGRHWPVRRVIEPEPEPEEVDVTQPGERRRRRRIGPPKLAATLLPAPSGQLHLLLRSGAGGVRHVLLTTDWLEGLSRLKQHPRLANVAPPAMPGRPVTRGSGAGRSVSFPVADVPYLAHVGTRVKDGVWRQTEEATPAGVRGEVTTEAVQQGGRDWIGTATGLFARTVGSEERYERHPHYGVSGPVASAISGMAVDSRDVLWVVTPAGLSRRDSSGRWQRLRGRDGLPWDELTSIAIDASDRMWIGSTRGLIHYRPYAQGRQWFYRAGPRYLPDDHVLDVRLSADGRSVLAWTDAGMGRVDEVPRTLGSKAAYLQDRLEERHRRVLGIPLQAGHEELRGEKPRSRRRSHSALADVHAGAAIPAPCVYEDSFVMKTWTHGPQPSDGLWTGYHVTAMSLAYSVTRDERYKEAARKGMEALYLLQNVTEVKGLVARSVMRIEEPTAASHLEQDNWHEAPGGRYIWRDDVSSDQIDGHYLAFYAYFEHIAQFDEEERRRIEKQVRQVTDYIIDNDYQVIDWDGKRTLWGWWDPERINKQPKHYLESGLYSLMMLSFLKTAYYMTDEPRYGEHFLKLTQEYGYLSNLLLEKKLFPDELNHSDDQLSAVAYYPFLQLEHDPFVRETLGRAIRRHALIEAPERNALFALVHATIDPRSADVAGALQTLRELPQDRRAWRMQNSHRLDVAFQPGATRGGQPALTEVLPYDEHQFERWNQDPYHPDSGGDGRHEGAGIHYLLPYWIARYHGLLTEPQDTGH